MKRFIFVIIITIILNVCACSAQAPKEIPVGTWQYNLLINGVEMGVATISNSIQDNLYIYRFDLSMGNGITQSQDTIIETLDCKPVKLEKHTYIKQGQTQQKLDIVALCNGNTVTLIENNSKTIITLDDEYVLDGNYFLYMLIKNKFKKGLKITQNIYDPSLERENTIPVTITLAGTETISVNSQIKKAWKIEQSIGKIKNIIVYLDENGVVLKSSIKMLNMQLDIIRKD
ncbi:MAG: hypothetical protein N3F66_09285 [Spirochaetes bacterium]|nr:hypothetical protein [Spirochaetota bacterium]